MKNNKANIICLIFFVVVCHMALAAVTNAEVLERIAAIVNDDVILLSEFQAALQFAKKADEAVSEEMVLNEMINRRLLFNEARKNRVGRSYKGKKTEADNSAVIKEYIDSRIKAFIHIPYETVQEYYESNRPLFADREFYDARDEIEDLLIEKELAVKLREHIGELRGKAYISIQLKEH